MDMPSATPPSRFRNDGERSRRRPAPWAGRPPDDPGLQVAASRRRGRLRSSLRSLRRWPPPPSRRAALAAALAVVVGVVAVLVSQGGSEEPDRRDVTISTLLADAEAGKVEAVTIDDADREVTITYTGDEEPSAVAGYPLHFGGTLASELTDAGVDVEAEPYKQPTRAADLALSLLPPLVIILFLLFFLRSKGGLGVGKLGKGKGDAVSVPATRFDDVAGLDEVVDELREVVELLHRPERFTRAGAKVPSGFLLEGGPGTGKTLLARAVAGEAGVPFFSLAGSDFVETFVGVGASRVRAVFAKARKQGRAIIFIDEIDAIGKTRSSGPSNGSTDEREGTLNALLVEMDGFAASGVIVLGATNRADTLDPALLRPGRFDRRIAVPNPDRGGREQIIRLHLAGRSMETLADLSSLARRTTGMSGADLEQLVNLACMEAARAEAGVILEEHLDAALQISMLGRARRSATVTDRDRRITAWHEAGHALAALKLEAAGDPVSVTIIPRGMSGGATWMDGTDDEFLTRSEAEASLVVKMSGRSAEEELLAGDFTTGAAGDFQAATDLALRMVVHYGMSDIGVAFRQPSRLEGNQADLVAAAVDRILDRALATSRDLLGAHHALLRAIAELLLVEETLSLEQLRELERSVQETASLLA
ncbi:MAG: ATP-dependent metallopeptidase FtsH/Yme1/Tma family protein [Acidimicrobiales bacterium]